MEMVRSGIVSPPAMPALQGCFFPRLLSGRRRSQMLLIFAVVSHCDCYNLWPSLQTPSSPPQMFDFNLVVGKNLRTAAELGFRSLKAPL